MADMLALPADLQAMPGLEGLAVETATILLEVATGIVQGEVGQILVEVVGDEVGILGTTDSWLALPERPVTEVTSVELDGDLITDYQVYGSRLWRTDGWAATSYEPSKVTVTYDHGYPEGDRGLELARSAVLVLAAGSAAGSGVLRESIDDYRVAYQEMATRMEAAPHMRKALRRRYGRGAGLVRLG